MSEDQDWSALEASPWVQGFRTLVPMAQRTMINPLLDALQHGDFFNFQGKADQADPMRAGTDVATYAMPGFNPAATASYMLHGLNPEPDMLNMFAGPRAKGWSTVNAAEAKILSKQLLPEDVWRQTEMFQGPTDSLWRAEIPEQDLAWTPKAKELKVFGQKDLTLRDVLHHPVGEEQYPDLMGYAVKPVPLFDFFTKGAFDPESKTFYLNPRDENSLSTAVHEFQHAIQEYEGFPAGGNPQEFQHPDYSRWQDEAKIYEEKLSDPEVLGKQQQFWKDAIAAYGDLTNAPISVKNIAEGLGKNEVIPAWRFNDIFRPSPYDHLKSWNNILQNLATDPRYAQMFADMRERDIIQKKIWDADSMAGRKYRTLAGETEARLAQNRYKASVTDPETSSAWGSIGTSTWPQGDPYSIFPLREIDQGGYMDVPAAEQWNRLAPLLNGFMPGRF